MFMVYHVRATMIIDHRQESKVRDVRDICGSRME